MIYEEYESIWNTIRKKEKELFELINKRDELFLTTQPRSNKFDKEKVDSKTTRNMMEEYVIQKEYLNERIMQLNITLDDIYQVLKRKRDELRQSKNVYDRIYYYFCIERLTIYKISNLTNYSQSQVYRKLEKMGVKVKDAKKCENFRDNIIL
jgi:Trm5-related predicted tRNA methylase